MKRITHVITAVAFGSILATSQAFAQNLRAGVKAGIDFSDIGGDAEQLFDANPDTRTGFSGGAFFGIDLHRYFRLQLDGQYVQKGAKGTLEGVEVKAKVDYFEFLLPFTLVIPTQSMVTPRLYAGPAIAFESSCKVSSDATVEPFADGDIDCEETDVQTKSTDFGVFFGGGLDLALGPGELTFDALYNLGLTDINDTTDEIDPFVAGLELKNKNIQLLLGYAFRFGGM